MRNEVSLVIPKKYRRIADEPGEYYHPHVKAHP
jgi:hypothetical protein